MIKTVLTCLLAFLAFAALPAQTLNYLTGLSGADDDFSVAGLVNDANGNTYLAGRTSGDLVVQGTMLAIGPTAFVAKFDYLGDLLWAETMTSPGDVRSGDVAVDDLGNVYWTGTYDGTATVGTTGLVGSGGNDMFLIKLDATGALEWIELMGGRADDQGVALQITNAGNVAVLGSFTDDASVGGSPISGASGTLPNAFLAEFEPTSALVYVSVITSPSNLEIGGFVADDSGNFYLAGVYGQWLQTGGDTLFSPPGVNIFLLKFNGTGQLTWAESTVIGLGLPFPKELEVDGKNLFLCGETLGNIDFGNVTYSPNNVSVVVPFVIGFDTTGQALWADGPDIQTNGTGGGGFFSMAVDDEDILHVAGYVTGDFEYGGTLDDPDDTDIIWARYSKGGDFVHYELNGGGGDQLAQEIATGKLGVTIAGRYTEGAKFTVGASLATAPGATDNFIYSFLPDNLPPVAVDDTYIITAGEIVVFPVLSNDFDPDGGVVRSAFITQNPVIGGAFSTGAAIIYQAPQGTFAVDSIKYRMRDTDSPVLFDTALVTILVFPGTPKTAAQPPLAGLGRPYPNPARDFVNIPLEVAAGVEDGMIQVLNVEGKVMWQEKRERFKGGERIKLWVRDWPAGMYWVRMTLPESGTVSTQQFVKE